MKQWIRGLIFTAFVPCVVGGLVPFLIKGGNGTAGGFWRTGWLLVTLGAAIYSACLFRFLASGGTPAIFFTRHLKFLVGEEPPGVVQNGPYRVSRNPMYAGVWLAVSGQAVLFASAWIAFYALALGLFFHLVVVFLEEPHLRRERGPAYEDYCRKVPRWLGRPG